MLSCYSGSENAGLLVIRRDLPSLLSLTITPSAPGLSAENESAFVCSCMASSEKWPLEITSGHFTKKDINGVSMF